MKLAVNGRESSIDPSVWWKNAHKNSSRSPLHSPSSPSQDSNVRKKGPNQGFSSAVKNGQLTTVRLLLNDPSVGLTNQQRKVGLHLAAELGKVGICKEILEFGTEIECRDEQGLTALHKGSKNGHVGVVELLCKSGAQVDVLASAKAESPLYLAAESGHIEVCKILLSFGSNSTLKARDRETACHAAARNGHVDICRLLVGHLKETTGENKSLLIAQSEPKLQTPLHLASLNGESSVCEQLIMLGASIQDRDADRRTVLHLAAISGNTDCVTTVFDNSILESQDVDGCTPLLLAAELGHTDVCKELLRLGANADTKNWNRSTPLHKVAQIGYLDTAQCLLDAHAKVCAGDVRKRTPLMIAASQGHTELCSLLIAKDSNCVHCIDNCLASALHWAAGSGHIDVCLVLLKNSANINLEDFKGQTPFHWAAHHSHFHTCKVLIANGAMDPLASRTQFRMPRVKSLAKSSSVDLPSSLGWIQNESQEGDETVSRVVLSEEDKNQQSAPRVESSKRGLLCRSGSWWTRMKTSASTLGFPSQPSFGLSPYQSSKPAQMNPSLSRLDTSCRDQGRLVAQPAQPRRNLLPPIKPRSSHPTSAVLL